MFWHSLLVKKNRTNCINTYRLRAVSKADGDEIQKSKYLPPPKNNSRYIEIGRYRHKTVTSPFAYVALVEGAAPCVRYDFYSSYNCFEKIAPTVLVATNATTTDDNTNSPVDTHTIKKEGKKLAAIVNAIVTAHRGKV